MAFVKTQRDAWIDAGLATLADGGPDAVKIERLARRLGVTKGGFYGYFVNRQALLDAMLDSWERDSTQAVVEQVEREALGDGASAIRAAQLTWAPGGLLDAEVAIREWARRDREVASRLGKVDSYRLDYLRQKMHALCDDPREAEVRSLIAYWVAIGMQYAAAPLRDLGQQRQDAIDLLTIANTIRPPWRQAE